jgi:hypothetical protein
VHDLTTTPGIVALAAAGVALAALALAAVLAVKVRRMRAAQAVVLGEGGVQDLVSHAAALQSDFRALRDWMEEMAATLDRRMVTAETRLDGAIAFAGLVRYDAYNEMSGRQSTSIALLDTRRDGIVLSSIHHRDQARLYAKRVSGGQGELELSPEEAAALKAALEGEPAASMPA